MNIIIILIAVNKLEINLIGKTISDTKYLIKVIETQMIKEQ